MVNLFVSIQRGVINIKTVKKRMESFFAVKFRKDLSIIYFNNMSVLDDDVYRMKIIKPKYCCQNAVCQRTFIPGSVPVRGGFCSVACYCFAHGHVHPSIYPVYVKCCLNRSERECGFKRNSHGTSEKHPPSFSPPPKRHFPPPNTF